MIECTVSAIKAVSVGVDRAHLLNEMGLFYVDQLISRTDAFHQHSTRIGDRTFYSGSQEFMPN